MDREKEIEEMVEIARKHGQKIFQETESYADIYDDMTAVYEAGYCKADEVRKETAKEIWEDLLGIIDEGYHRPQVNTTISSPFMNGENCAYNVVIVRMKQALKEKYGVEVDE